MDAQLLQKVIVSAVFVEALIQTVKPVYDKDKGWSLDVIITLVVGELVALGLGVDIFAAVGLTSFVPYVGMVLTGILISRGANLVHDLMKTVQQFREQMAS